MGDAIVKAGLVAGGGALLGPLGATVGGLLGAALFPPKVPTQRGPKIGDQPVTTSAYGQPIPLLYGTIPLAGNIIDAGGYQVEEQKQNSGAKGGPQQTTITYRETMNYMVLLAEDVDDIVQVKANGRVLLDRRPTSLVEKPDWFDYTFYDGSANQEPSPTFEAIHGAGNVPAYRGVATMEIRNFLISEFGTSLINFEFIATRSATGSQSADTFTHTGDNTHGLLWHPRPAPSLHRSMPRAIRRAARLSP